MTPLREIAEARRKELGLSYRALAKRMGATVSASFQLCNAYTTAQPDTLKAYCKALDLDYAETVKKIYGV